MNNKLLKKFMQFAMGNGIVLVLGFISSPIITRLITPDNMGKFSMFNTISNLIFLFIALGLDQAYVRFFYEENEENRKILLKESIKIPLIITFVSSVFLLIFYRQISKFIVGKISIQIVIIMVIHILFSVLGRFSLLVVRMKQKAKLYSFLQVIGKVFYILLVLTGFVFFGNSYLTVILAIALSNVVLVSISIYCEKNEWNFKGSVKNIKTTKKELLKYGSPLVFSMTITWIFQSIDKVTINKFKGYEELGLYAAAFSIVSLLNAFKNTFTTFWVPVANQKYVENPEDTNFFVKINKMVSMGMIILGILLIGFKDIIVLLLGQNYRSSVFIFPFLVLAPIMYTISETTVMGIGFKKKNKYHIYISLVSAAMNLIGNLIMVPLYGAKGAAVSTGIAYIVFFSMRTILSNKVYKVKYELGKYYTCTFMLILLALYSTFNSLDLTIIILTIVSLAVTLILYKDVFLDIKNQIKKKVKL